MILTAFNVLKKMYICIIMSIYVLTKRFYERYVFATPVIMNINDIKLLNPDLLPQAYII